MTIKLKYWLGVAILSSSFVGYAASNISVVIDPVNIPDPAIPVIAGPIDFSAYLIDESTVQLSWNPVLLDGSEVDYFNLWDKHTLIASTTEHEWRFHGIDRNDHNDFAVSAVTVLGEETRRSSRIYYDLPQLDANVPDGWNQYLPPLENLKAEVVDDDSVILTWDVPPAHWSWAEPSDYSYAIVVNNSYVEVVDEPRYTHTGLADSGEVWIGVSAEVSNSLSSRQPHRVLVDTSNPVGTVSTGVTGYSSVSGLRTEVYSSTAAELFWDVGNSDASHVFINGILVARIKEGHSLFIENLPPGERLLVSVGEGWPYVPSPEFDYILSYDSPLMHTWIDMPDAALPNAGEPTAPVTGLRAEVYSSTAAEIFWDRSDSLYTRYRIYFDELFFVETDAVSWFFDELPANSTINVGVVAIEPAGSDGEQSGQLVETSFTTFSEYGIPTVDCQVKGLFPIVYSSSAAEVFWNRDTAGTRYDLFLNDEFLINTDATSWFIEGLQRGSDHVFAINIASADCYTHEFSVQFSMDTSANSDADNETGHDDSIINRDNHAELVREVFSVYVGDYYTQKLEQASEFSIAGPNLDSSFIDVFDCDSGSFEQELDPTSTNAGVYFSFTFDQCRLDDEIRHGYVSGQDSARGLHFNTDQYSINQDNGGYFKYTGFAQKWISQTAFFDRIHSFDTAGFSVAANHGGVELTIEQMNTSFAYGNKTNGLDSAWLRGGFNASLDVIGGSTLTVSTPVEFYYALNTRTDGSDIDGVEPEPLSVSEEQRNRWTFTSGQLYLAAEDGSSLQLDADTGDADTVKVTITSAQGVAEFYQNWSLWSEGLRFEDYPDLTR